MDIFLKNRRITAWNHKKPVKNSFHFVGFGKKHIVHERTNDNGQRVCNMAMKNNLVISCTKFKHPRKSKVT